MFFRSPLYHKIVNISTVYNRKNAFADQYLRAVRGNHSRAYLIFKRAQVLVLKQIKDGCPPVYLGADVDLLVRKVEQIQNRRFVVDHGSSDRIAVVLKLRGVGNGGISFLRRATFRSLKAEMSSLESTMPPVAMV